MSYSQNKEDVLILEMVSHLALPRCVFEIGAHNGKWLSNSLALIEKGWNAVLVEPSPSAFLELLKLHANRPNVMLLNAAVGTDTRITKFYECEGDLCSTTSEANLARWPDRKFREYWVPQITVSTIVAQLGGGADVLSVDTEGTSFDIVRSCPIDSWSPRVIVVEHDDRMGEIAAWGREKGYRTCELNGENIMLMKT